MIVEKLGVFVIAGLAVVGILIGLIIVVSPIPLLMAVLGAAITAPLLFLMPLVFTGLLLCFPPFFIIWWGGGISPLEMAYSLTFIGLLAVSAVKYLIAIVFTERPRDLRSPIFWPLICFLAMALVAAVNAANNGIPFNHWASDLNGLSFYALYFILAIWVTKAGAIKKLFSLMTVMSVAGVALSVTLALRNILWPPGVPLLIYIAGVPIRKFGLPTDAGIVIFLVSLSLAISLKSSFKKTLFTGLFLLFGLEQISSFTRARWIGDMAGVAFIIFLMAQQNRKRLLKFFMLATISACVFIMLVIAYPSHTPLYKALTLVESRFSSIFVSMEEPAISTRVSEWEEAFKKAMQHPILGNGLGTSIRYYRYDKWYGTEIWETTRYIHNSYIYLFLNMGLLGILAFGWLCVSFIGYGIRVIRAGRDDYYKGLAAGFTASFVAILVASMFTPTAHSPIMSIWVGFLMGSVYIIDLKNKEEIQ